MAPPTNTLWPLDPHTIGKHLVLRAYLDAWFPIIGRWNKKIIFLDGFSGPGEYQSGEEGSPQIAMRALVDHSAKIGAEVKFFFIEKDDKRAKHLDGVVKQWKSKLPSNAAPSVITGQFDETMEGVLANLDEQKKQLAPTFAMIDPFGVAGTPLSVVRRIMKNPQCEVYVSLMYESLNRFKTTSEFASHLDDLFGCKDWRELAAIEDSDQRRKSLYDLYEKQLRDCGAKHVVHFDIYKGNKLIYSIFFATQHEVGCDRMKQAIWKAAPNGEYEFRGTHSGQLPLTLTPSFEPLKKQLLDVFGDENWHSIKAVQRFVQSDKTDYHSSQLKRSTLKPMEQNGQLIVDPLTRNRPFTYPDGCKMRFVQK
jgi:three-Cys-motif partner protein